MFTCSRIESAASGTELSAHPSGGQRREGEDEEETDEPEVSRCPVPGVAGEVPLERPVAGEEGGGRGRVTPETLREIRLGRHDHQDPKHERNQESLVPLTT